MSAPKKGRQPVRRETPQQAPLWREAAVCLALAAMTFAVFGQTRHHQFINYDDNDYVYENPMVVRGLTWQGLAWAFSYHAFNWHPLTWLSHMLDCQLYGLNPAGHHVTSVILHAATAMALFLVLRQMTGALWRSAFVAAVFAIHPLRVESVAWVAERKDVLSGLFFMLTIGAYVRYVKQNRAKAPYVLSVFFFVLGLMSKPMLVTLPLVLLLLDYWPLRRPESFGRLVLEKLPFFALSAASCCLTLLAQKAVIHLGEAIPLPLRCANAACACVIYLGQIFWPENLAASYPFPFHGVLPGEVAVAGAILAALSIIAFWQGLKRPWLLVGWLWYVVMLLPVLGIVQVGRQAHADRYTYLPQIGLDVALIWLVAESKFQRWAVPAMIGVIAALMVCAWKQTGYWQDSATLWNHALVCTADNDVANFALGNDFFEKGKLDEAIVHFQKSVEINPNHPEVQYNLGSALYQRGRLDEAIARLQIALQQRPDYEEARNNLGTALLQEGRLDEAIAQLQLALQLRPNAAAAHLNLGIALLRKAGVDEAIGQFQTALQLKPAYAAAHYNLGIALSQKGQFVEAVHHYQAALQLTPDDLDTRNNLAWLLATSPDASLRDGAKAAELARQANELTGGQNPTVLHTLAAALAETGQFTDAITSARKAMELAKASGQQDLLEQIGLELKRYQTGHAFHEQPIMDGRK